MVPKPKAIVFDLDGTLAESKQRVSAEMGELLTRLTRVTTVAVMSGAGLPQFEKQFFPAIAPEADLEHLYIFPDNAAQCFRYVGGSWKPQYDHAFSQNEKDHIMEVLTKTLAEVGLAEAPVRVWGERIEDRGAEIVFSGLGQQAPLEEKQKWDPTGEKRHALQAALVKNLPEFSEAVGGITSVDITRKGINKAYGVKRLSELTNIAIPDMLYVGDALDQGGNDSVVIESGIKTHAVFGPEETAALIETILKQHSQQPSTSFS